MIYLDVKDLTFYYGEEPVLQDVSFSISSGEFVALTGENGAAKSTLIKACLGILKPKSGSVMLSQTNIQGQPLKVGYIPQQVASFNAGFPSTVYEFVCSGRYKSRGWFHKLDAIDHAHAYKALEAVGLLGVQGKRIGDLSGGQKQRIILARLFASDPDFYILDEPTTGMDEKSRIEFYKLMQHNAHVHNKSILMITHDYQDIKDYVDRHINLVRSENTTWRCFHVAEDDIESKVNHDGNA